MGWVRKRLGWQVVEESGAGEARKSLGESVEATIETSLLPVASQLPDGSQSRRRERFSTGFAPSILPSSQHSPKAAQLPKIADT